MKTKTVKFGVIGGNRLTVLLFGHEVYDSDEDENELTTTRGMLKVMKERGGISQTEYDEIYASIKEESTREEIEDILSKLFPESKED